MTNIDFEAGRDCHTHDNNNDKKIEKNVKNIKKFVTNINFEAGRVCRLGTNTSFEPQ